MLLDTFFRLYPKLSHRHRLETRLFSNQAKCKDLQSFPLKGGKQIYKYLDLTNIQTYENLQEMKKALDLLGIPTPLTLYLTESQNDVYQSFQFTKHGVLDFQVTERYIDGVFFSGFKLEYHTGLRTLLTYIKPKRVTYLTKKPMLGSEGYEFTGY